MADRLSPHGCGPRNPPTRTTIAIAHHAPKRGNFRQPGKLGSSGFGLGPCREGFDQYSTRNMWRVRDEDARVLLGGMSNGQFYDMKKKLQRTLDIDTLARISYLIGIFRALNILYSEELADAWIQRPNKNRIFGAARRLPT